MRALIAGIAGLVLLAGPAGAEASTFAQHPGFDAWFAANPPSPHRPDPAARERLRDHRPVLRVPAYHPGPLDFYRDYIAHGTLTVGEETRDDVDRAYLARRADDPDARFSHRPPPNPDPTPVAYGRVDRRTFEPFGEITFLTWHFVFRKSGLPAEMPGWQSALAWALGDREDWHQLDHYTAVTLALGPAGEHLGIVLQQHNTLRSYWYGRDHAAPADGRPRIAVARRSNELYPWTGARSRHRVVRFLEPGNLQWLATGTGEAPWTASHDIVPADVRQVDYTVHFLPQTDPFYRFQGRLGETRLLPGRDGPPGADYNALPAFKNRLLQFCALRWTEKPETPRLTALRRLLESPTAAEPRSRLFEECRAFVRSRVASTNASGETSTAIGYNAAATGQGEAPQ